MRRFRIRRRRALAIALAPAAVITIGYATANAAPEPRQATIEPAKTSVRFGGRVTLRGQFPGAPNAPVAIQYRAADQKRFRQVGTTRTNENSRWTTRVKPHGTGMWRARLSSAPRAPEDGDSLLEQPVAVDSESGARRVAVRSITDVDVKNHAITGRSVRIDGRVKPGGRRKVIVRVGGQRIKTHTDGRGRFDVKWRAGSGARAARLAEMRAEIPKDVAAR